MSLVLIGEGAIDIDIDRRGDRAYPKQRVGLKIEFSEFGVFAYID